jgi:MipA family protein
MEPITALPRSSTALEEKIMMHEQTISLAKTVTLAAAMLFTQVDAHAADSGVGLVGQLNRGPQVGENSNKTSMAPFFYYDGESIYADFQEVFWKAVQQPGYSLSPLLSLRFQGYDPDQDVELAGMDSREPSIDAGARFTVNHQYGYLAITALTDTLNKHNGYEFKASWGTNSHFKRWMIDTAVGISHKSDALVDYYYGVRTDEATEQRPAYTAGAATNPFIELNIAYMFSRKIILISGLEFSRLDNAIQNSPIIKRSTENVIYSGMLYKF